MSPLDVIEIPGHPGMFARRITVEMWQRAGSPPINKGGAGRLKSDQQWLYDQWKAQVPGYNPADNPNELWRPLVHVRFIGLDVPPKYAPAMRAAGFEQPYDYEPWHFQVPRWWTYPLVTDLPATAGAGARPFPIPDEGDDSMRIVKWKDDVFAFDTHYVEHIDGWDEAVFAAYVAQDRNFKECRDQADFDATCEVYAVPARNVELALQGRAYSLEGVPGQGRIWSLEFDKMQTLDNIWHAVSAAP